MPRSLADRSVRLVAGALLAAVLAVLTLVTAQPSRAGGAEGFIHTFTFTGAEQPFTMPEGAETVDVVAIGGSGGDTLSRQGGDGGRVEAKLDVIPLGQYYIEVGGTATGPAGGFNGGGDDGASTNAGGGGGGATDIRTVARDFGGTLNSRLLIAPGGGGAGAPGVANMAGQNLGGDGGDAGSAPGALGAGAAPPHHAGGGGGGLATGIVGGTPGAAGVPDQGSSGAAGGGGSEASGGQAGDGNAGGGTGGGGGGGLTGGGGGGGGGVDTHFTTPVPAGGGGGGGGSALLPPGPGGIQSVAAPDTPPSLTIDYSLPGTVILGVKKRIKTRKRRKTVSFELGGSTGASTFRCRFKDSQQFSACPSPYVIKLRSGRTHRLQASAIDNQTGNYDASPAVRAVKIIRKG